MAMVARSARLWATRNSSTPKRRREDGAQKRNAADHSAAGQEGRAQIGSDAKGKQPFQTLSRLGAHLWNLSLSGRTQPPARLSVAHGGRPRPPRARGEMRRLQIGRYRHRVRQWSRPAGAVRRQRPTCRPHTSRQSRRRPGWRSAREYFRNQPVRPEWRWRSPGIGRPPPLVCGRLHRGRPCRTHTLHRCRPEARPSPLRQRTGCRPA